MRSERLRFTARSQLEAAGLIEFHYRYIDLVDRGGLSSLLDEPDSKHSTSNRAIS